VAEIAGDGRHRRPAETARAAALVVIAIGLWASAILPEHVTALLFFLGAMLLRVAPAAVIFSGFASPAWWLVLGGLLIGIAVEQTGLGRRLADRLLQRNTAGYRGALAGIIGVCLVLGFLMPSAIGRTVLLIPITLALADQLGFEPGSNGRIGLVVAVAFGCYTPTFTILTANVPNMILLGSASTLYGHAPGYGEYLLLHFPVLGLLKAGVMVFLIERLFPDRPRREAKAPARPGRMTPRELLLALVLLITLALWMTDFLHHISPGWIALGAGIFCLLPGTRILPRSVFNDQLNFAPLIFVAGVLGMGALVAHSGLGELLTSGLLAVLPLHHGAALQNLVALMGGAMLLGPVTTTVGVPALLTPMAAKLAALTGLPLRAVLMSQIPGISTTLLPYQAAPLVVAFGIAEVPLGRALRFFFALAAVTILLLLPLDLVWWHLLGWW
jgi:anion transporter